MKETMNEKKQERERERKRELYTLEKKSIQTITSKYYKCVCVCVCVCVCIQSTSL